MRSGLWLVLTIAACGGGGDDGNGAPDARVTPDAIVPDANTQVDVTVYQSGAVAEGVVVQYADASGAYVGSVTTDSAGHATIDVFPAGGSLTAPVSPRGEAGSLTSVLAVSGGASLTIGNAIPNGTIGGLDLTLTGTTVPNATVYSSQAWCGGYQSSNATGTRHHSLFHCDEPPPTDVSAVIYAGASFGADQRLAYDYVTEIPLTGDVPNLTGAASFTGWRTDFADHTIAFTNVAAGRSAFPWVRGYRHGHAFRQDLGSPDTSPQTLLLPDGLYDGETAGIDSYDDTSDSLVAVRRATAPTGAAPRSDSFDATADILDPIHVADVAADGLVVAWTGHPTSCKDNPGSPDGFLAQLQNGAVNWFVFAPGTQASPLQLPGLDPATASTLWPTPTDAVAVTLWFLSDQNLSWSDLQASADVATFDLESPAAPGTRCLAYTYN